jgi:hypothetical protein
LRPVFVCVDLISKGFFFFFFWFFLYPDGMFSCPELLGEGAEISEKRGSHLICPPWGGAAHFDVVRAADGGDKPGCVRGLGGGESGQEQRMAHRRL